MRILTFQSEDVLDIILKEGNYRADPKLSREQRDYSKDIEQSGGYNPIWGFTPRGKAKLLLRKGVLTLGI